ncbi:HTH-type transcriptional regulator YodB [Neobacillus rhizosphaerae]|uniref:HTH-type transcriptional regulator YodB n=1 Tax=Neobacillus rhizosphaerae TaxID=2880965 RepID=A0ABM9ENR4_9BACI|nr:helix-turn-helix domain-containing protein [Neobacillus rhizosphaerae]CAH2714235.1 HTH-type transcriptional regulator YodB [Neobacillus rhizosphaerae]
MTDNCLSKDKREIQQICTNFHSAIEFIGKRWMGAVIYSLLDGPKRYHEIVSSIPGISDRLLTERLRDLEREGLIVKNILNTCPKKVVYELTPVGKELKEVIRVLMEWVKNRKNS